MHMHQSELDQFKLVWPTLPLDFCYTSLDCQGHKHSLLSVETWRGTITAGQMLKNQEGRRKSFQRTLLMLTPYMREQE